MSTIAAVLARFKHEPAPERSDLHTLLAFVLGRSRSFFHTWPQYTLTPNEESRLQQLEQQYRQGQPLAYLLGEWEFWGLNLTVTPDVLIPRPDTESVVEKVLALGRGQVHWRVADLGTGSGAIACALAKEHSSWQIIATDKSAASLQLAQRNAQRHHLGQIEFKLGSWCQPLTGLFDCIVSNPPYLADDDPHLPQLNAEPRHALVAAEQGLADLSELVQQTRAFIKEGGWLVLEHGYQQAELVQQLLQAAGWHAVSSGRDYGGNWRYSVGQR